MLHRFSGKGFGMKGQRGRFQHWIVGVLAALILGTGQVSAQDAVVDVRRAQATRAELEAALVELDKITSSPGYSGALRRAKEAEAAMVRQRLAQGDFQVGDQIEVAVVGDTGLTGTFTILPGRLVAFPNLPPISLEGVLRSESSEFLTAEIGKYVKNPQVLIQASYIRLAVLGAVSNPGYYNLPADRLISDAIMMAGGPTVAANVNKSIVRRANREIIPREQMQAAVARGQSLDHLNLHGGDEIIVGGSVDAALPPGSNMMRWLLPAQLVLGVLVLGISIF